MDEALAAGIEHCIFVIGPNKSAIEHHFGPATEVEPMLGERRRTQALAKPSRGLEKASEVSFALQDSPLGLGHAIWCARDLIGDEPFAVLNPDVITRGDPGCLAQILETYSVTGGNVVSIEECSPDQTTKYGIVATGKKVSDAAFHIAKMVEKPRPGSAPSNLKISGRYILQPMIFEYLAQHRRGSGGEIQLTDAMIGLGNTQPIFGHRFRGRSFDCGSKEGFIAANVAFALDHPELRPLVLREIDVFLRNLNAVPGRQG